jgi:hypothetical protein
MRQLIILVCYLSVGSISLLKVRENVAEINKVLKKTFSKSIQNKTNTIIKTIVIPVRDQKTYLECIFPTEPDLPEEIKEQFNQIELTLKEYDTDRSTN